MKSCAPAIFAASSTSSVAGFQPPVADVLAHRAAEQVRRLEHDPDALWMLCRV
jgi:hypothetical protein